ncbi:MAG: BamA/TamA family outer membrane protein [Chitinophagales bacterium]|nr:BamA/TamA family outer membrane protein [Chitinophagales bacterium]
MYWPNITRKIQSAFFSQTNSVRVYTRFGMRWAAYVLVFSGITLFSCSTGKYIDSEKGERLLEKNTLKIKSEKKLSISAKSSLTSELTTYFRQKPNRKNLLFFNTRLWFWHKYKDRKSDFAQWINKRIAEAPVIYDSTLAQRTALNFKNQMRQRGYFRAECEYRAIPHGKTKITAVYDLNLGPRYTVDQMQFVSRDSQILRILQANAGESLIKNRTPLDVRTFDAEKLRITNLLKNNGYAYFIPQFIEFGGDSTGTTSNIIIEVLPFSDSANHKVYTINRVEVLSGVVPNINSMRSDTTINGVYFAAGEAKLWIKPRLLRKKILLDPGELFKQSEFDKTLRNLNALGVYRFVSLRPVQDSVEEGKMNVIINLSPNQRFHVDGGLDLNYSRNSISNGLLGLSPIVTAQNRNMLSGAEHIQSSLSYNIEFDIANPKLIFSQEFKFQNELLFPQYFDYFGFWKLASKIKVGRWRAVPKSLYNRIKSDGEARLSLNYNYLNVTDFYNYHLSNASFGYRVRSHPEHQYNWDHVGLDMLRPKFDALLAPSEFLRRSFGKQLFTGFILRNFNYTFANRANRFGERYNYRFSYELSGLEVLALNRAWPLISGKKEPVWRIADLDFAQYIRFDQEGVYTRNFNDNLVGAVRMGAGVAVPFGNTGTTPFVKQFFVGGPSSLRAWRIRQLGPGSYVKLTDDGKPDDTQPYFQAADLRFEFGGELRFPLFLWFKGAVFIDGGNIWTLKKDDGRPGSELRWDSYRNIAIGTGFGLRMDVDYFVLRFDVGLPLRRPYIYPGTDSYWVKNLFSKMQPRDFNPNLAVGYPF